MPGFDLDAFAVDLREAALHEDADKSLRGLIKGAIAGGARNHRFAGRRT